MPREMDHSPEAQQARYLARISDSLQSISRNMSHEFGPFKAQNIVGSGEEAQKRMKEIEESRRRDTEINELKRSNKIAKETAKIALVGMCITAIASVCSLAFDVYKFNHENKPDLQVIVAPTPSPIIESASESASIAE